MSWGVPDWTDPSAYGDTGQWSLVQWRWEFTRRREDYRADFDGAVERTLQMLAARTPSTRFLSPDEPGFVAKPVDWEGCFERYGLGSLPNPRIANQPPHVLIFRSRRDVCLHLPDQDHAIRLQQGTVTVSFDLSKPIDRQWQRIRETVIWHQEREAGIPAARRVRRVGRDLFLRALDGRQTGATFARIASTLWPDQNKTAQSARDAYEAGCLLRDNFPE